MDSRKYYYLKLKENFFESDSMILLENMKDGYLYSNILLKLYLRSLKDSGRLMLNNVIPYNAQIRHLYHLRGYVQDAKAGEG